jgi:D-serine deaminase-like pyridoxal phosphate-dependent protein
MRPDDVQPGSPLHDIETPALLLDIGTAERNLQRMVSFLADRAASLRPHVKLFRATPQLARMQLEAGAIGMTCAKVSEAEVLAEAGIPDILIANEVVGAGKLRRLAALAQRCDVKVAVDSRENVEALSQAAQEHGVSIGVLVEVNIGHNRCGVAPFEPALELAQLVLSQPGLRFKGLMGYDGHCTMKVSEEQREPLSLKANTLLADTRKFVKQAGIDVEIVSGGGTFTYRFASAVDGVTEVQAGSYLLMDTAFREHGVREFDPTLSVLTTVISRPTYPGADGMVIVDAGRKSISPMLGLPEVKHPAGGSVLALSDEHTRVTFGDDARIPQVGETVEIVVRDANATINQFDRFHVVRDGLLEAIWPILLCGDHT